MERWGGEGVGGTRRRNLPFCEHGSGLVKICWRGLERGNGGRGRGKGGMGGVCAFLQEQTNERISIILIFITNFFFLFHGEARNVSEATDRRFQKSEISKNRGFSSRGVFFVFSKRNFTNLRNTPLFGGEMGPHQAFLTVTT